MKQIKPAASPSLQQHKSQFFWQILLPFLCMTALIMAAAAVLIPWGRPAAGVWRDISIMWLLIPLLILSLLFIGILVMLIYGFAKLTPVIPKYTGQAQKVTASIAAVTQRVADGIQKPFAWIKSAGDKIRSMTKR
jgi:hypothetical protein